MHDRTHTPNRHRAACDRAIATLEHAALTIGRADRPRDPLDTIDTFAARLILDACAEAIAGELRRRITIDDTIRQAAAAVAELQPARARVTH